MLPENKAGLACGVCLEPPRIKAGVEPSCVECRTILNLPRQILGPSGTTAKRIILGRIKLIRSRVLGSPFDPQRKDHHLQLAGKLNRITKGLGPLVETNLATCRGRKTGGAPCGGNARASGYCRWHEPTARTPALPMFPVAVIA